MILHYKFIKDKKFLFRIGVRGMTAVYIVSNQNRKKIKMGVFKTKQDAYTYLKLFFNYS
jgi:hypothetical protein